ncbi:MAG: 50S ribosomal protein L22 [Dehalococcoidia bacterium]|nr:50S ribosomal protein L22 [Dehalococcoidia bacterium]
MLVKAVSKGVKMSSRKVRRVADMVRGKRVDEALAILEFTVSPASVAVAKVIKSAVANADVNFHLSSSPSDIVITNILVDEGPMIKRIRPRARGRAGSILKRSSHITVLVEEMETY